MQKLKILFIGMPDMGTLCLNKLAENQFNIVAAIGPKNTHPSHHMFYNFAKNLNVNCLKFEKNLKEDALIEQIKNLNPDIGVVCSFDKKIPKELYEIPKMGIINCHPSFLPYYRGGNPYFHVIKNNEMFTGITLHMIDEGFDTGEIIYREKVKVEPDETMGTLFNRLNYKIADALISILKDIEEGIEIKKIPQPHGEFPAAPSFSGEIKIDWNNSAENIQRYIRACNPFYTCCTLFRGVFFRIYTASYKLKKHKFQPGEIVETGKNFAVAASDGLLYPKSMQVGTYMVCDNETFSKVFGVQKGEKLG